MTYFSFLARFIGPVLILLLALTLWDNRRGRTMPAGLRSWPAAFVILAHVIVAILYTTPWDNYLVATGVWWYNPKLVTGLVLGWVPIEEYTFFVVQTLLTGLWLVFLARRLALADGPIVQSGALRFGRWTMILTLGAIWLASAWLLLADWKPGTYLALELVWALPPIMFQLIFAGDILWHYRTLIFWSLIPATLYLSFSDAWAIGSGTWTIDPVQSTRIFWGALPLEELVFFLLTNTLVVFGMVLVLAEASKARAPKALLNTMQRAASQLRMNSHPANS